ncbi:MAG: MarR family winged helix-turn-helix transcriptional regulator [Candidatus Aminicenantia bacterium]
MTFEEKVDKLAEYIELLVHRFMMVNCDEDSCLNEINFQEIKVIEILGKKHRSIMRELADEALVAISTMTGIIDRLVEKGFVTRYRTEEDRRVVIVELTEKGMEGYQEHLKQYQDLSRGMLMALNEDEQDTMIKILGKISGVISGG